MGAKRQDRDTWAASHAVRATIIAAENAAMLVMNHFGNPWAGETTHMGFRAAGALTAYPS